MPNDILSCPRSEVKIDCGAVTGPLEAWRQSVGQGGINWKPLPPRVVEGVGRLKPRLTRVFLQEFFDIYPAEGRFNWTRLDPYLESFARTGATVVAAITIKPPPLFPSVDPAIWRPNDVKAWQNVIRQLVRRYSVERKIVSHWEIGNETDIGESGGCPYLIPDPDDYMEYYRMTIGPVLEAWPEAKVGGPACCWVDNQPLPGLVERCRATGTQLDFISWHLYSDDADKHVEGVRKGERLLAGFGAKRPEMFVTEWSKGFEPISVEDRAFHPRRAATIGAAAMAMLDTTLDCGFYYHISDQTFYWKDFAPFYSPAGQDLMHVHWNEIPHRFGLFGVAGEVRPQYFIFQMLARMAPQRIAAGGDCKDIRVLASQGQEVTVMLVNHNPQCSIDRVVSVRFANLSPGRKTLTTWRIDGQRRWDEQALELFPLESREVDTQASYHAQVFLPADSVLMMRLAAV
jgi:hypothetical protein